MYHVMSAENVAFTVSQWTWTRLENRSLFFGSHCFAMLSLPIWSPGTLFSDLCVTLRVWVLFFIWVWPSLWGMHVGRGLENLSKVRSAHVPLHREYIILEKKMWNPACWHDRRGLRSFSTVFQCYLLLLDSNPWLTNTVLQVSVHISSLSQLNSIEYTNLWSKLRDVSSPHTVISFTKY